MSNIFSRILVGVDDSDIAQAALAFACRLAREHDSRLVICSSVNWLPVVSEIAAAGAMMETSSIIDDLKADGEAVLDKAMAAAKRAGVDAERRALEGDPAESILAEADRATCSLIVMGTHSRQGLERLFIGSTTAAVLRASEIPVLTMNVGTTLPAEDRRCFEHILAGVDDSEPSEDAIQTILDLPAEDRQSVTFCSVADSADDDDRERAQRVVTQAVQLANEHKIAAAASVIIGHPDTALIAAAETLDADLIVVGSHGRRGLQRFVLGSVAEGVVEKSPVPVLVVRTLPGVKVLDRAPVRSPAAVPVPS